MYWFILFGVLLGTASAVNVFTPPCEVCSGEIASSSCSKDGLALEWSYDSMRIVTLDDLSDASMILMVDGIDFTVTLIFLNNTVISSNISFTATPAADGKVLQCTGGTTISTATIRVVTDAAPPVISGEHIADVVYEGNSLKVTLQFTITNRKATPTLEVSPQAVFLGSLQNVSSSTFTTDITLHYNINYTLTITASNCAGSGRQHINFLRVNCFIPNVAAGVRLWPITDTTEGVTITYGCSDGYFPQTNQTSQCTQVGSDGVWMPDPALSCSIVCSAPPSPLNGSVQANDSRAYVEGDVVNFQCLSGLIPAYVMIAICSIEGRWMPDPQLLTCSSSTEDSTTCTANTCTQVIVPTVISGVCCLLLGLLCGVGAVIVYNKCSRKTHPPPSQPPPLAPLYDDIELPTTTKHEVELGHNVAYGHLN